MSWNALGTVTVTTDWQLLNSASSASTFRVSFLGNINQTWYYARIRQYFSSNEVSFSTRLYPKNESMIIELPIPQALMTQGLTMRYLGVCKFPNRRYTVPDSDWQILIEELV